MPPSETDETLMQRVAAGQLPELAPLYARYKGPLLGFLLNRGRLDRATAEDLLHTVFERIITYRTSWRAGQTFRTWVYTIARNVHHDHCRLVGRMPLADAYDLSDLPLEEEGSSPPTAAVPWPPCPITTVWWSNWPGSAI